MYKEILKQLIEDKVIVDNGLISITHGVITLKTYTYDMEMLLTLTVYPETDDKDVYYRLDYRDEVK